MSKGAGSIGSGAKPGSSIPLFAASPQPPASACGLFTAIGAMGSSGTKPYK